MILTKPLPWGEIRGKLSLSPEQAQTMLGFNMRPDAKGVYFTKRNDKLVVCNLIPPVCKVKTNEMTHRQNKMKILGKIVKEHYNTLIKPIWNRQAKNTDFMAGAQLFTSLNSERLGMPPDLRNLLLTTGNLAPPELDIHYCPPRKLIEVKTSSSRNELQFALFDTNTFSLHLPVPVSFDPEICNPTSAFVKLPFQTLRTHWERKAPILFAYFKQENEYSDSVSWVLTRCPNHTNACNAYALHSDKCYKGWFKL